ncbi:MAG: HAD family phosphatase [Candidatus Delongbacteria bacterium]|nr:HAD family phosphatase [Candidatus Delongbacteria bacterium]
MKAILYDMDGLLIDSETLYGQVEHQLCAEFGREFTPEIQRKIMGTAPMESISIMIRELDLPISPEILLDRRDRAMERKLKTDLEAMPGVEDILTTFDPLFDQLIVTTATTGYVKLVMQRLPIQHHFSLIQTSDGITRGKPDPEIYITAMRKKGYRPSDCIVLEDSGNGVKAGKTAGCYVIAVPSEHSRFHNFDSADYIALNLLDARDHILLNFCTITV